MPPSAIRSEAATGNRPEALVEFGMRVGQRFQTKLGRDGGAVVDALAALRLITASGRSAPALPAPKPLYSVISGPTSPIPGPPDDDTVKL